MPHITWETVYAKFKIILVIKLIKITMGRKIFEQYLKSPQNRKELDNLFKLKNNNVCII